MQPLNNPIQKILVIRFSSIGDIVLTTPLLRVLKKRFPAAKIDFVSKVQFRDVLSTNPHLHSIYTFDPHDKHAALKTLRHELRANRYDLIIDAHNNFRSHYVRKIPGARIVQLKKYKWRRFFLVHCGWNFYRDIVPVYKRYINTVASFGVKDDGQGLEFFVDPTIQSNVQDQLQQRGWSSDRPTLAIAPGASFATKRWPVERFAHVAQKLINDFDVQILLLGDQNDAELTRALNTALSIPAIDCAGQFNLMESACALNCADALLTNDTGLMHLGTALKKPVVAVFGSTVRELGFYPFAEDSLVVENKALRCRPCSHIGKKSCPKKHFKCMMDIESTLVLKHVASWLEQQSRT